MSPSVPRAAVMVLLPTGAPPPQQCLASLRGQSYPSQRFQVNVVEMGPRGRSAVNDLVAGCNADVVALVKDDVTVDAHWLEELVAAAERHHAQAVAARIEDGAGQVEFAGAGLTVTGQLVPALRSAPQEAAEAPLLFACGDAALYGRAAFLEAGGLDEGFSGCLDDVDLGWRLNALGHSVVLAPKAVARRRSNGAGHPWLATRQHRLRERNALAMIYKNYEAPTLERVLPMALALSLLRGLIGSGIDTLTLNLASRVPESVAADPRIVAHLIALEDFCRRLPELRPLRDRVQARRTRSDAELWRLFGDPLRLDAGDGLYADVCQVLLRDLGVEEMVLGRRPASQSVTRPVQPAAHAQEPVLSGAQQLPRVSIVILTALGPTHLPECLGSLRAQTYPADRIEVVIVDNGSAIDPTPEAQKYYPGAQVILNGSNIGFAAGNNVGALAATGDYLVFLNDDTRVHPDFLAQLVETARRRQAPVVGGFIADWAGRRVDFVEGAVNFQAKGFQLHYDAPIESLKLEERPLLFACGCAMLIDREVFLDAGKWDEGTFAYYEDVELGWRLNLLGHSVWLSPRAVVYHKHHGTSGRWPEPPRTRLYERNSLRMLYEVLEPHMLARALPAALLLTADRALLGTTLSRAHDVKPDSEIEPLHRRLMPNRLILSTKIALVQRGVNRKTPLGEAVNRLGLRGSLSVVRDVVLPPRVERTPEQRALYLEESGPIPAGAGKSHTEPLPIDAAAVLSGLYGFFADLPALTLRRADVQARRRTTDADIVGRFGSFWYQQCPARFQLEHDALQSTLVDEFRLGELASSPPASVERAARRGKLLQQ